jgi:quercetin dioxygenase-like cupin family protein
MSESESGSGSSVTSGMDPARAVVLGDLVSYAEGSIVSRTLARTSAGSMSLFAFEVGQQLSEHTAPFDALVQVLDGRVELVIGGEAVVASAGESVLMPANVPHAVNARQRFKMLLTMLKAPAADGGR